MRVMTGTVGGHDAGHVSALSFMCSAAARVLAGLTIGLQCQARAETTPMGVELKADSETLIECRYSGGDAPIAGVTPAPGTYHYRLYLPGDYNGGTNRFYPLMFIASPSGDARMGAMADRLKRDRWVVAMLVESRNGPDDAPTANFLAAHDDVTRRVRVLPGLKAGTGLSGGARAASFNAAWRPGFRCVIFQAAGLMFNSRSPRCKDTVDRYPDGLLLYALFGNKDYNFSKHFETEVFRRDLPSRLVSRVEVFQGGHNWAPAASFSNAMDMIEATVFLDPAADPGTQACAWYFDTLAGRLSGIRDPVAQYEALESARAVALKGRIENEPSVSARLAGMTKLMDAVRVRPEVGRDLEAREAYRRACGTRARFDAELRRRPSILGKQQMEEAERALLRDLAAALEGVVSAYTGCRTAARAAGELAALRLEYADRLSVPDGGGGEP